MSLIAELKRRSVFKVGAAYLVVAWLAIQAASILFPTFEAPAWVLRIFVLVVFIGFPIALVMSWVFEVGGGGIRVESSGSADAAEEGVHTPVWCEAIPKLERILGLTPTDLA